MAKSATTSLLHINLDMLRFCQIERYFVNFAFGQITYTPVEVHDYRPQVKQAAMAWLKAYEYAKESYGALFADLKVVFGQPADVSSSLSAVRHVYTIEPASQPDPQGVFVIDYLAPNAHVTSAGEHSILNDCYAHYLGSVARWSLLVALVTPNAPMSVANAAWYNQATDEEEHRLGLQF